MIKKLLLSIATIFLIWQSYKLLISIHSINIESLGLMLLMAWLINLFITGIFAFSGFAFPTQRIMPTNYYTIKQPKRLKKTYKFFRIDWFRQILLATLWRSRQQQKKYFDGTKTGILNLIKQSKKSEFGHLIPFVLINVVCVWLACIGLRSLSVCTFVINFLGNFYPIILQRHHRMRIQLLHKRYKR